MLKNLTRSLTLLLVAGFICAMTIQLPTAGAERGTVRVAGSSIGAPSQPAKSEERPAKAKKKFRQIRKCATYYPGRKTLLSLDVPLGKFFYRHSNDKTDWVPCADQFYEKLTPTVENIHVKIKWLAGKQTIRSKAIDTRNKGFDYASVYLIKKFTRVERPDGSWTGRWALNGKPVRAAVTISKNGYRTQRFTVKVFDQVTPE